MTSLSSAPKLPFAPARRVGDILYLSGQMGTLPGGIDLAPGGMEAQARQTMHNIRSVVEAHGLTLRDVFKCTVMLADMTQWAAFNQVYLAFFDPDHLPTRSAFGANGLALGGLVEVEAWAAYPPEIRQD